MKFITAAAFVASCFFSYSAFSDESAAKPAPSITDRKPANLSDVDPVYDEPGMRNNTSWSNKGPWIKNRDGYDGARVQFYYDPMSTYSKIVTNNGIMASQFGYTGISGGMGGVQAMWAVWAPSDFEFQTGLDYVFPIDVQGAQSNFGNYYVNSQTLSITGFKALQANYRINIADFTSAAYGGFGVYYGKNQAVLRTGAVFGDNTVTYTKLMMVYVAGARIDYNFNRSRTIAAGIGAEFFVPTKITDQISQDGAAELVGGQNANLRANMDFWTGIGCRLYAGVAAYF